MTAAAVLSNWCCGAAQLAPSSPLGTARPPSYAGSIWLRRPAVGAVRVDPQQDSDPVPGAAGTSVAGSFG